MTTHPPAAPDDKGLSFKLYHDLMAWRVNEILLVSSPYDAFIMEADGRLAERIIYEYNGLNLSRPPRLTWVSTAVEALEALSRKDFDIVITMPFLGDMPAYDLGREIKEAYPHLPVFLLAHHAGQHLIDSRYNDRRAIDKIYIWSGNTDLLLAIVKNIEDRRNVDMDTKRAMVRVIILVEDSPFYCSSLLPMLYKEIVTQTQLVMEESVNDAHRLLKMRGRPKILVAENFEEAMRLFHSFKPYLLCMLSDVRFMHQGQMDSEAGITLLTQIKEQAADLPLLIFSSEVENREAAEGIPAAFVDKNALTLHRDIRHFFRRNLGFGAFIFRMPDGREVGRAANLGEMEHILPQIPGESVNFHARQDHFSTWFMARAEIPLAQDIKPLKADDFSGPEEIKSLLITRIRQRRRGRQHGVVSDFTPELFESDFEFFKIGKGSLGGKARGLAFAATMLQQEPELHDAFPQVNIHVPGMLVITTDGFDAFVSANELGGLTDQDLDDVQVFRQFAQARFPNWLTRDLDSFLEKVHCPLSIRSSSLLEDAHFMPCAGVYETIMVPNQHPEKNVRLAQLIRAVKQVWASTWLRSSRAFVRGALHRAEEEKMAVIVQKLTGREYGGYFYPMLSGVAQSHNFYPLGAMQAEDGIAHIALGLGKTVMQGRRALRFSPKYPQFLPQLSSVDDILNNAQQTFYAMSLESDTEPPESTDRVADGLSPLDVNDAALKFSDHAALQFAASRYVPQDHRIKDGPDGDGRRIILFNRILKYNLFPLPQILIRMLELGQKGVGGPVEIEFACNLPETGSDIYDFALLQIRPMSIYRHQREVDIAANDIARAFCYSQNALGSGSLENVRHLVYVRPERFEAARTREIAAQITEVNHMLLQNKAKYVLVGPGRWGSADTWLGIPVGWNDISQAAAIVETLHPKLKADPSQGTHFFHNLTSLGINYLTIMDNDEDFVDWTWLENMTPARETGFLRVLEFPGELMLKLDIRSSRAVLLKNG